MNSPSAQFELPLALLHEQVARARFLPRAYANYQPLLADGLRFFLERLSPERLTALLLEQAGFPGTTPTSERLVALLQHLPALHKLGQVVARDHRLHLGLRRRLHRLESLAPRTPAPTALQLLESELPHWRQAGIELSRAVLAEGSVALVLPFRWGSEPKRGVFKLLKPGVQARLEEDLEILGALGDFLDVSCERYHLPALDYRDTFDTIRLLLLHEVRLDEEQEHLAEAGTLYAANRGIVIPGLLPFCTPRLTAMDYVAGAKIVDGLPADAHRRRHLASVVADALVAQPIFSSRAAALFHADPHAGNLLLTPEGKIGIIDWSLAGRLHKAPRVHLGQLVLGALAQDAERMQHALAGVIRSPNTAARFAAPPSVSHLDRHGVREATRRTLQAGLRELRHGTAPGLGWLTRLLDNLVLQTGLPLEGDLLLFRKSLLTLEGVLADVLAQPTQTQAVLDEAALSAFWRCWAAEWPGRWFAPFDSRSFATHLSTADHYSLFQAIPAAVLHWWREAIREWVQPAAL